MYKHSGNYRAPILLTFEDVKKTVEGIIATIVLVAALGTVAYLAYSGIYRLGTMIIDLVV